MVREYLAEIAANPKIALGVSVASTGTGAGVLWTKTVGEVLAQVSVFVGIVVSIVVLVVQVSTLLRENKRVREEALFNEREQQRKDREHELHQEKSRIEIEILRQKAKVLEEIDRLSND